MQRSTISNFVSPVIRHVSSFIWKAPEQLGSGYQYKKEDDIELGLKLTSEAMPILEEAMGQASTVRRPLTPGFEPLSTVTPSETFSAKQVIATYASFVFAKENHQCIIAASLLTVLGTTLNFLAPYILGTVINSLGKEENEYASEAEGVQLWMITCLVFVYTLSQLVPNIRDQMLVPVASRNTEKLVTRIIEHQLNKSLDYHINTPESDQIYLIQKGFSVTSLGTPLLTQVAPTLLEFTIAIAALSYQYGLQMGLGMSTLLALYTTYCAVTTQPIIDARETMLKRGSEAWKAATNAITRYKTIHDFNKFPETMKTVAAAVKNAADAEIKDNSIPLRIGLGHIAIPRLGMLAATLFIGMRVQSNQFTVPEFVALFGYLNQFSASIPALGKAMNQIFASYPDLKFVFSELDKPSEIVDAHPEKKLKLNGAASIRIEDVIFSYSDKSATFNHLSLTIKPGQTIALVSESGAGKTTLFNLLYGYYTPSSGGIYINDQNIAEISRVSLQDNIGLIGQNPNLFNGSVRDNIKFGAKNPDSVTDEVIFELAQHLNLSGFICTLARETEINLESCAKGLNIDVGEGGKALSGGQQQKVAILRGFLKNTPIRLLDEVTSSLDAESASAVLAGIKKMSANATTLVITHHLAEITSADNIFVLDKGSVIAQGTHKELLQSCSLYQKLWMKQNQTKEQKVDHATTSVTAHMGMFHSPKREHYEVKKDSIQLDATKKSP